MDSRIAVIGAGAVGGYVGGHLARLGLDVTLVDPWPEHVEAIRANGLNLYGLTAEERCTVRVPTMHLTELQSIARQRPIDIAIVSVKSYDTEWATMMVRQYLSPGGYVVSLQNCINEERIAGIVGWGRVVGCIAAAISVDLYEPGHIRRTVPKGGASHTVFRVGEVHGRVTRRAEELAAMIAPIDSVKVTTNLWGERWSKLCLNGMRNGVSAATGLPGNAVDRDDAIRRFCIRLGGEAVRIGQALGYELEHIGKLDPERLARASEGDAKALEEVEAIMLAGTNSGVRSELQRPSMGQDMLKGRRTEIDFMNGFIAAKGTEIGRPAGAHAALTAMVKRVERGEVPAQPENVTGLDAS
ncbi:ketopantoate reductase family protein [Limobrevibacterium gyesilva]|uniref:2-dehydropantoate 2-reductase n=1 Tax=Limobrevibacterium gyesilva TaxID=2991712 RepID=A0AA41YS74_9PROT|nr:2-dehydropantoate 2-reductase [Limobrevibacterium gyesilva]MCW3475628.1 2-dehydropantoate 2-reductase [Limobrevibacterium gyesilva]